MLSMMVAGRIATRTDPRELIGLGFGLTAFSLWQMVEHINLTSPAVQAGLPAVYNLATQQGLAALNNEVTRQATFLAYINDFTILMVVKLIAMPLLLLMRRQRSVVAHGME